MKKLGEGRFSKVYLAKDIRSNFLMAVKVIKKTTVADLEISD